ncbi:DUF1819 family protein [Saprospiraceae bacterium]|nr:DUF1819 family protein [Saprospiraceae bacterium]
MVDSKSKYKFSFTSADLKLSEMVKLAMLVEDGDIDIESAGLEDLQAKVMDSRESTNFGKRAISEIRRRYLCLTDQQRRLLADGTPSEKQQIAYLSICKLYSFVLEFVTEVLREKVFLLDYQLLNSDINSFINRKRDIHDELDALSTSTLNKSVQVLVRMLVQSGILSNTTERRIIPQIVSHRVAKALCSEDREVLGIFLLPEGQIKAI